MYAKDLVRDDSVANTHEQVGRRPGQVSVILVHIHGLGRKDAFSSGYLFSDSLLVHDYDAQTVSADPLTCV